VTARAIYANPADALWSGSISDFAENGFVRSTEPVKAFELVHLRASS
jgi:hypothetical protein